MYVCVCVVCTVGWLVGVLLILAFWGCMYVCVLFVQLVG